MDSAELIFCGTVKKISYYSKAKSKIKIVLDAYDEHQAEEAKDGRQYTTGYVTLEDGVKK